MLPRSVCQNVCKWAMDLESFRITAIKSLSDMEDNEVPRNITSLDYFFFLIVLTY